MDIDTSIALYSETEEYHTPAILKTPEHNAFAHLHNTVKKQSLKLARKGRLKESTLNSAHDVSKKRIGLSKEKISEEDYRIRKAALYGTNLRAVLPDVIKGSHKVELPPGNESLLQLKYHSAVPPGAHTDLFRYNNVSLDSENIVFNTSLLQEDIKPNSQPPWYYGRSNKLNPTDRNISSASLRYGLRGTLSIGRYMVEPIQSSQETLTRYTPKFLKENVGVYSDEQLLEASIRLKSRLANNSMLDSSFLNVRTTRTEIGTGATGNITSAPTGPMNLHNQRTVMPPPLYISSRPQTTSGNNITNTNNLLPLSTTLLSLESSNNLSPKRYKSPPQSTTTKSVMNNFSESAYPFPSSYSPAISPKSALYPIPTMIRLGSIESYATNSISLASNNSFEKVILSKDRNDKKDRKDSYFRRNTNITNHNLIPSDQLIFQFQTNWENILQSSGVKLLKSFKHSKDSKSHHQKHHQQKHKNTFTNVSNSVDTNLSSSVTNFHECRGLTDPNDTLHSIGSLSILRQGAANMKPETLQSHMNSLYSECNVSYDMKWKQIELHMNSIRVHLDRNESLIQVIHRISESLKEEAILSNPMIRPNTTAATARFNILRPSTTIGMSKPTIPYWNLDRINFIHALEKISYLEGFHVNQFSLTYSIFDMKRTNSLEYIEYISSLLVLADPQVKLDDRLSMIFEYYIEYGLSDRSLLEIAFKTCSCASPDIQKLKQIEYEFKKEFRPLCYSKAVIDSPIKTTTGIDDNTNRNTNIGMNDESDSKLPKDNIIIPDSNTVSNEEKTIDKTISTDIVPTGTLTTKSFLSFKKVEPISEESMRNPRKSSTASITGISIASPSIISPTGTLDSISYRSPSLNKDNISLDSHTNPIASSLFDENSQTSSRRSIVAGTFNIVDSYLNAKTFKEILYLCPRLLQLVEDSFHMRLSQYYGSNYDKQPANGLQSITSQTSQINQINQSAQAGYINQIIHNKSTGNMKNDMQFEFTSPIMFNSNKKAQKFKFSSAVAQMKLFRPPKVSEEKKIENNDIVKESSVLQSPKQNMIILETYSEDENENEKGYNFGYGM